MARTKFLFRAICGSGLAMFASTAFGAPVVTAVGGNASLSPVSFTYMGSVFTFGATGDLFNPLTVQNSTVGAFNSFGGFLGIPVTPTSSFVDRGTVTFGPNDRFASFLTPTVVPFSLGQNFIGLRATVGADNFYGFAYTTNTIVNSIGFETTANEAITATTAIAAAVPEPGTWVLMILGFGAVGYGLRRRRAEMRVAYSA